MLLILRGPRHEGVRGRLLSAQTALEQGRVAVLFEGAELPLLALDEEIEIELFGSAMGRTLACGARVLEHRAGRGWASYVLELPDHVHSSLEGLLERRSSLRARPAVVAPVDGTLSVPDGSLARAVVVKDLSVTGAALYLAGGEDLELLSHAGVRVSLVLPGASAAVELRATLVWRRRAGAQIVYGVAFDPAATPDFRAARAQLADWVARRSQGGAGRAQAG